MRLNVQFSAALGREDLEDYTRSVEITVTCYDEDVLNEYVVGKLALDQILWADAQIDRVSLFEICDNDSQGMHNLCEILTKGKQEFRSDLEIDEPTTHVLFLYKAIFHPSIHPYRQGILDAAFRLFGDESLAVTWKETSGLSEMELAELGFRKVARCELIFRHSTLRTDFGDQHPTGINVDAVALPEYEEWVVGYGAVGAIDGNGCAERGRGLSMSADSQQIVAKAWNFAHVLRDDRLSYMAYTEQITFLLFLKMADELSKPPYGRPSSVPPQFNWQSLLKKEGDDLEAHYRHCLEELGKQPGMLGEIFKKARPDVQKPATLRRLIVDLIEPVKWASMNADVKGDIYEGLLARSAEESPKGAGQYFTPRQLIQAVVACVQPGPDDRVCDPAAGTGGFLLAAYQSVIDRHTDLDRDQKRHLRTRFVTGWELVPNTARLCIMNLYLHGIDADPCPVRSGVDSLASDPGERFSLVLTNPPFGKKSSIAIVNEAGDLEKDESAYERQDFWTTTKNKQLNFLQHARTLLKVNGRCAIVVPDNVLFEGGAGETVRRN